MEYIVDVQGFRRFFNQFVFKEVAIIAVQEDAIPTVLHFQPPFHWSFLSEENKCSNRWLELNFHGLSWSSGRIPYEDLKKTLHQYLMDGTVIYVKGVEKKKWLQDVLPYKRFINLEDIGCPAFRKLPVDAALACNRHPHHFQPTCAMQNAYAMMTWLIHQPSVESRDEVDSH